MNRTITALVTLLRTFADELEGNAVAAVAAEAQPEGQGQPAPKRGRPAKTAAPAIQEPAQPESKAPEGMSLEELQALIKPIVAGYSEKNIPPAPVEVRQQVKALIAKHGGTSLSTLPPASHEAFKADVEGLVY